MLLAAAWEPELFLPSQSCVQLELLLDLLPWKLLTFRCGSPGSCLLGGIFSSPPPDPGAVLAWAPAWLQSALHHLVLHPTVWDAVLWAVVLGMEKRENPGCCITSI